MSTESSKRTRELTQAMRVLARNPELYAKNPSMLSDTLANIISGSEVSFVSFNPSVRREDEMTDQMQSRMEDICQKVTLRVLEQVRSEIPRLFEASRSQLSASKTIEAIGQIVKMISKIDEVRKVYARVEPEGLRITIIHDSTQRLELLRKVMEIEGLLDARFEDVFFQFDALYYTEIDESSVSNDMLIFLRS